MLAPPVMAVVIALKEEITSGARERATADQSL